MYLIGYSDINNGLKQIVGGICYNKIRDNVPNCFNLIPLCDITLENIIWEFQWSENIGVFSCVVKIVNKEKNTIYFTAPPSEKRQTICCNVCQ